MSPPALYSQHRCHPQGSEGPGHRSKNTVLGAVNWDPAHQLDPQQTLRRVWQGQGLNSALWLLWATLAGNPVGSGEESRGLLLEGEAWEEKRQAHLSPVHDIFQSPEKKDALPLRSGNLVGGGGWKDGERQSSVQDPSLALPLRAFLSSSLCPSPHVPPCPGPRGMAVQPSWD